MTFRYQPLDIRISDGAVGGPGFVTIIGNDAESEVREAMRSKARGNWDVSYAARREAHWRPLQAHFLCMHGRADTWPFRDRLDYRCSAAEAVLVSIDSTHWQMYKRYTVGSLTYDRKLVLPFNTTVAGGGSYSVGAQTGIITKLSGADPTGFVTDFYKLCRYDTDEMRVRQITHKADGTMIVEWAGIPIKEVIS